MNKFGNSAIIGNKNMVASFSEEGELLRACFPQIDGRQFVDYFKTGVKINDSNLIYLHQDINNKYKQNYVEDTNILVTNIENAYFNLSIEQTDCVCIDDNIILKKYVFENNNSIDLNISFIVNSKILAGNLENFGSRIINNGVIQYNYNYSLSVFSNYNISGHKLNDIQSSVNSGVICDKDYIGMSNEVAVSYDLGVIKPGDKKVMALYIYLDKTAYVENKIEKITKMNIDSEINKVDKYWKSYVQMHKKIDFKNKDNYYKKISEIYTRTILLYPLLVNETTGGIAAALEVDENREKSGSYSYCWTRDAIFITKAFNLLNMEKETELFYNNFCRKTQSSNGMWEQRFYTDTTLAPCWGYQIDETASVVYGVFDYYEHSKKIEFLKDNLKMCENATKFLCKYVENILNIEEQDFVKKELEDRYKKGFQIHKQVSYDLWEMNEGVHLYSISSIISAFECMKKIYELLDKDDKGSRLKKEKKNNFLVKLNKYSNLLREYINENLIDKSQMVLKRNTDDCNMDISIVGAVYPFNVFNPNEKVVQNTIDKINMTLRTYTSGYLRFENDNYMSGSNPWVITTLWMALYYVKVGEVEMAKQCFNFVVDTACKHGFLAEQVSNENGQFKWVVGLGWSHAMFIIVLNELIKYLEVV